jgi:probable addiction module antidote protein
VGFDAPDFSGNLPLGLERMGCIGSPFVQVEGSSCPWETGCTPARCRARNPGPMKDRAHDDAMAQVYRDDPSYAAQLLSSILEDGDQAELLNVLRQMTKAFGGVQTIAEQAHLNPTQLYRTLSAEGNPALSSFSAILKAMGMRLAVQPMQAPGAHA